MKRTEGGVSRDRVVRRANNSHSRTSTQDTHLPLESQIAHLVGQAGDVALMHPFLIHGFGANQGNRIRFACNPLVQIRDNAEVERLDGGFSPVELALRKGLGLE